MGLFHLVEQHDLVGSPPHRFGERAAFVVADIAGRRADHAADRMLLHVLAHIETGNRRLVVEHEFRQRLRQFGLADTGRAQKQE